jgi:putative transposase
VPAALVARPQLVDPGRLRVLRPTLWAGRLDNKMATRKKHTPEQVVRKLATADRMLNDGKDVANVCRELQVSEQAYYRWRNQFGGMKPDDAKRLKGLERRTPRSSGCWPMPSWRRSHSRRSRRETSEPGAPAGGCAPPDEDPEGE